MVRGEADVGIRASSVLNVSCSPASGGTRTELVLDPSLEIGHPARATLTSLRRDNPVNPPDMRLCGRTADAFGAD